MSPLVCHRGTLSASKVTCAGPLDKAPWRTPALLQLSETADTFDNSLVVEVPRDDKEFVADSPDVLAAATTVRDFVKTKLLKGGIRPARPWSFSIPSTWR
jgi:hypothetical protein